MTPCARSLHSPTTIELVSGSGKAVKIGHGPATVIGRRCERDGGMAESQETYRNLSKLTLFARKSVATRLAILARLFYWGEHFGGKSGNPAVCDAMALRSLVLCSLRCAMQRRGDGSQRRTPRRRRIAAQTAANKRAVKRHRRSGPARSPVPAEVKRIVTLAPNLTETVYALGLDDHLVGDTNFCDTPASGEIEAARRRHARIRAWRRSWRCIPIWCWRQLPSIARDTADALKQLGVAGLHHRSAHGARNAGFDGT